MANIGNFLMSTFRLDTIVRLLKTTFNEWSDDKAPQLGAALAYYTVFSLAPLMLLIMSVLSLFLHNKEGTQQQIKQQISQFAGQSTADVVGDILKKNADNKKSGIVATAIGVALALFGASGVFGQLQDALNTIWGVKAKPGQGIMGYIRARFISFAMVGGVCFLLLVSLSVSAFITGMSKHLDAVLPGGSAISVIISILINLVIITALFAMIFRFLPDAKIAWSDVWVGAGITSVLFIIGKWALSLYLGSGSAGSAYGAAGGMITTLVWVYYSAQIMLFGAEFTQVYSNEFGSHVVPVEHAVRVEKKEKEIPVSPQERAEAERKNEAEKAKKE
jgi:membrane protein